MNNEKTVRNTHMVRDRVEEKGWQHLSDISLLAIFSGFDWIAGLMEAPALETQLDANSFASPVPLNFTPHALPATTLPMSWQVAWDRHRNMLDYTPELTDPRI